MHVYFGVPPFITKIFATLFMCLIFFVVIEPEKIDRYSTFTLLLLLTLSTAMLLDIIFIIKNIVLSTKKTAPKWNNIFHSDFSRLGLYFGNSIYSMELNGSYLAGNKQSSSTTIIKKRNPSRSINNILSDRYRTGILPIIFILSFRIVF